MTVQKEKLVGVPFIREDEQDDQCKFYDNDRAQQAFCSSQSMTGSNLHIQNHQLPNMPSTQKQVPQKALDLMPTGPNTTTNAAAAQALVQKKLMKNYNNQKEEFDGLQAQKGLHRGGANYNELTEQYHEPPKKKKELLDAFHQP